MRRRISTIVALAMAMAPLPVEAASRVSVASETSRDEPRRPTVRLTVETSAMRDEAETTREWVLRDGVVTLAAAGINVSEDEAELDVRVSIEPRELGYTVTLEIWEAGGTAPLMTRGPEVCEACTRTEVLEIIERELAWVGGWLSSRTADVDDDEDEDEGEDEDTAPQRPVVEPAVEPPSPAPEDDERELHALGWSGIGVAGVGLGTLIGGLAVALRPYEAKGEPGSYRVPSLEHPQRVGWALFGIGAVAAAGGAVMLVLDLEKDRARKLRAGPWLDRQAGGLWLRRSF